MHRNATYAVVNVVSCPLGAAELDNRVRGRLGELLDVTARAGAGRFRGDRGDDFAPDHALGRALDRVDHRDRRLPAAGDHIDVRLVDVRVAVDDRNGEGADPRR